LSFFQAEDGSRSFHVTGVQTCALPISRAWLRVPRRRHVRAAARRRRGQVLHARGPRAGGRARRAPRERVVTAQDVRPVAGPADGTPRDALAHNYHPLPVTVATAEGSWVTDVEGRRYLD